MQCSHSMHAEPGPVSSLMGTLMTFRQNGQLRPRGSSETPRSGSPSHWKDVAGKPSKPGTIPSRLSRLLEKSVLPKAQNTKKQKNHKKFWRAKNLGGSFWSVVRQMSARHGSRRISHLLSGEWSRAGIQPPPVPPLRPSGWREQRPGGGGARR